MFDFQKTLDKIGSTEKQFLKMLTTNDRIFNIEEYKCLKYNVLVNVINLNKRYVCNNHIFAKNNHKILHCSCDEVWVFYKWLLLENKILN